MKDNSLDKLGGICAILLGLSYVVIGLTTVLEARPLTVENNAQSPFMFFEANQNLILAQYWAMALGAVVALAVIPAVSAKVRHLNEGWVRWTATLATLGYAVTLVDNYVALATTAARAQAFIAGSEAVRAALSVPGAPQAIDTRGWLAYGAVGLWILVVNWLALRGGVFPKPLAYVGLAAAGASLLTVAAMNVVALRESLLAVATIGGVVLGPIWCVWVGVRLSRAQAA